MTKRKQIELGNSVRCAVTGFAGIAMQHIITSRGTIRWAVTPKTKDPAVLPEAYVFDDAQLSYIGVGVKDRVAKPASHDFQMMDKIRSKINKDDYGIVTAFVTHMNGCVNMEVERESFVREINETPAFSIPVHLAELEKRATPAMAETAKKAAKVGGPVSKVARASVQRRRV